MSSDSKLEGEAPASTGSIEDGSSTQNPNSDGNHPVLSTLDLLRLTSCGVKVVSEPTTSTETSANLDVLKSATASVQSVSATLVAAHSRHWRTMVLTTLIVFALVAVNVVLFFRVARERDVANQLLEERTTELSEAKSTLGKVLDGQAAQATAATRELVNTRLKAIDHLMGRLVQELAVPTRIPAQTEAVQHLVRILEEELPFLRVVQPLQK